MCETLGQLEERKILCPVFEYRANCRSNVGALGLLRHTLSFHPNCVVCACVNPCSRDNVCEYRVLQKDFLYNRQDCMRKFVKTLKAKKPHNYEFIFCVFCSVFAAFGLH
jgi:hypothetical protein